MTRKIFEIVNKLYDVTRMMGSNASGCQSLSKSSGFKAKNWAEMTKRTKACRGELNLDAKQIEANMAAFRDTAFDTIKPSTP